MLMDGKQHTNNAFYTATVVCKHCQTRITVYDTEDANYFGCPSCNTFFRKYRSSGQIETLQQFTNTARPDLALGSTANMDGVAYWVTGFMVKREIEEGELVDWKEYLLYNKDAGYVTLVEFSGHWMLVKPVKQKLSITQVSKDVYTAVHEGTRYRQHHEYYFQVIYAAGAFDENVLEYKDMYTREFVAPPKMLISERFHDKTEWYQAIYKYPRDVAAAFGIPVGQLPSRYGAGIIEPSPYAANRSWLTAFSAIMCGLLVITAIAINMMRPGGNILQGSYSLTGDSAAARNPKMIVTEPFVTNSKGSLEVELHTSLNNDWLETAVTLVNDNNGKTYDFSKSLEYYYGYDDGERWSEGSEQEKVILAGIPAGKYHLNISPYHEHPMTANLDVTVRRNPFMWSNMILLLLVILSIPVVNHLLDIRFEKRRAAYE